MLLLALNILALGTAPDVLWDNGDTDGTGGYSNGVPPVYELRRSLLDDFVVPDDQVWRLTEFHHVHIWDSAPPGSGTGTVLLFHADSDGAPGEIWAVDSVTGYAEEATGRTWFSRPEVTSWTTFKPVPLGPGHYWFEAAVVGPDQSFWMIRSTIRENECWVNYQDLNGLESGFDQFGYAADLAWSLSGTIQVSCPADIDRSGTVGIGDILAVISAWGPCAHQSECPEDLDGDGEVAFSDLLLVLAAWGPCS
ncbi:MAG: hypothetical protein ACE5GT_11825 [Rhodospirillales bacterium]